MEPIHIDSVGSLLLQVSRELKSRGWALICTEVQGHPYQFTLGLESRYRHPELEVVGLTPELGQLVLTRLVERIAGGARLQPGEFFSNVLKGHDVFVVDNPIDPGGPPLTGGRLRAIWPDARHRYPWQADCEPTCEAQSILIEPDGLDRHGLELLFSYTGRLS
ncbi:MAG TPA: DUF4262 domain-containing protein [bacterium]|jgi:hypothetical protein